MVKRLCDVGTSSKWDARSTRYSESSWWSIIRPPGAAASTGWAGQPGGRPGGIVISTPCPVYEPRNPMCLIAECLGLYSRAQLKGPYVRAMITSVSDSLHPKLRTTDINLGPRELIVIRSKPLLPQIEKV